MPVKEALNARLYKFVLVCQAQKRRKAGFSAFQVVGINIVFF
jgi:hypothetical protein